MKGIYLTSFEGKHEVSSMYEKFVKGVINADGIIKLLLSKFRNMSMADEDHVENIPERCLAASTTDGQYAVSFDVDTDSEEHYYCDVYVLR